MAKSNIAIARDALYYPHIDIQDVEWLKRTLLVFPHVARIVPAEFDEDGELGEFEQTRGRLGQPLLRRANLMSAGVWGAQQLLLQHLRKDIDGDAEFINSLRKPVGSQKRRQEPFVVHPGKMTDGLIRFLDEERLIWSGGLGGHGRNARRRDFVEVHPSLGEAIMSTLAIACAKDEGFEIVTDSGNVHASLAEQDERGAYDSILHSDSKRSQGRAAKRERIELLIFQRCDTRKLTPQKISKLGEDWEAISKFRQSIEDLASSIPEIEDEKTLSNRLTSEVDEILLRWKKDKPHMGAVAKEIFGVEGVKPTAEAAKKLFESLGVAGLAGVGAAQLLGLAPGILIGFAVHGVTSWNKVRERARNSPYHYLTKLETAGLSFSISQ